MICSSSADVCTPFSLIFAEPGYKCTCVHTSTQTYVHMLQPHTHRRATRVCALVSDNLYYKHAHTSIQHIICNRNVFTNFLPCSYVIHSNNETCLVTCAVSLTCATVHGLCSHSFSFDLTLNQDSSSSCN